MFTGEVDVSEMLGSSIHLHVDTLGASAVMVVPTMDQVQIDQAFKSGSRISYNIPARMIHLFNPETEENIEYGAEEK